MLRNHLFQHFNTHSGDSPARLEKKSGSYRGSTNSEAKINMTRGREKGKRKAVSLKGGVPKDFRHESESKEEDGIQWDSVNPQS